MADKFINETGVATIRDWVNGKFVAQETGKGLSTNDYTTTEKNKLSGIASGAEVNQNAFSNVKVGSTTVAADGKTDTLELAAGSNITLTPDATNDKVTIATSAEANQNAFSRVNFLNEGDTSITTYEDADNSTDALNLKAGNNIIFSYFSQSGGGNTLNGIQIDATDTTYTPASATPLMDGTGAVGTSAKYAREDHVHPSDTSRVPTTRKVNGHALSADVTVTASDVGLGNVDNTADADKEVKYATALKTSRNIDGVGFTGASNIIHYGTCDTAAATTEKAVSCSGFSPTTGAWIAVKFTVTNTGAVASLKLNVNSTSAKSIKYRGGNLPSAGTLAANRVYFFVYDGTNYELVGDLDTNTTYSTLTQAIVDTGTETTGKLVTAKIINDTIDKKISAASVGAATFKGTVNAGTDISSLTAYSKGWYWVVATAGTYVGQTCEPGDMIFCVDDFDTAYSSADFSVVQNNLDIAPMTVAEINAILNA